MGASGHSGGTRREGAPTGLEGLSEPINRALQWGIGLVQVTGPGCPARLAEAMRYALLAPGKRLRPALVLMAGEVCGVDPLSPGVDRLFPAAAAVEMIHAYSLIHDDLPAMDDDDLRRGRPTVHLQFDEATAILAGDALLTGAFACLASQDLGQNGVDLIAKLAEAAGATRLVGGQSDDLAAESDSADRLAVDGTAESLKRLEFIHRRKTGALIGLSLELGAIMTHADAVTHRRLADYADDVGLAFQVVDDLLDSTSDESTLGKRAGKDMDRGKLTYPALIGVDGSRKKAKDLVESAIAHATELGPSASRLVNLARYVLERTH
ncbi:MAG: polyprenyl synthetase family protein [Planctomycetota bacterium]